MSDRADGTLGCAVALAFMAFGAFQIYAGFVGLSESFGWGWAVAALVLAFWLKFTVPMVVGCYLYAANQLGWPWYFAALFAAPGLLFMIPSLVADLLSAIGRKS